MDFLTKWSIVVQDSLPSFPKEIVKILSKNIMSGKQQYIEKYSQPQYFTSQCILNGPISAININCGKKKRKLPVSVFFDKREEDEKCKDCGCKIYWFPESYRYERCYSCHNNSDDDVNSVDLTKTDIDAKIIVPLFPLTKFDDDDDDQTNDNIFLDFRACTNCSVIDFCPLAKNENQVCLMDEFCNSCHRNICRHAGTEAISYNSYDNVGKIIYANCLYCEEPNGSSNLPSAFLI
jgi:hypothetical protein